MYQITAVLCKQKIHIQQLTQLNSIVTLICPETKAKRTVRFDWEQCSAQYISQVSNCTKIVNLPIPFITIVKISINITYGSIWLKFGTNIAYSLEYKSTFYYGKFTIPVRHISMQTKSTANASRKGLLVLLINYKSLNYESLCR